VGFKIIQILLSAFIISLFLGIAWNVLKGFVDGYMDARNGDDYNNKINNDENK
jgi:hypothetical protein